MFPVYLPLGMLPNVSVPRADIVRLHQHKYQIGFHTGNGYGGLP
jgi:hypothetical protein